VFVMIELEWEESVLVSRVLNLSMGGAYLELPTGAVVEAGAIVQVHLSADEQTVSQDARVVRVVAGSPPGFAASWIAPTPAAKIVLASLLRTSQAATPADLAGHAPAPVDPVPPRLGELPVERGPQAPRESRKEGRRPGGRGDGAERKPGPGPR